MKLKAKRNQNTKFNPEKKNSDLLFLKDITNERHNKKEQHSKKEEKSKTDISNNESIPKSKNKTKNKIKYDPIVFRMIQNKNKKVFKPNIVYCISLFLTFEENLSLRLICKLFNSGILIRYDFLKNESFLFTTNNKIHEKIRKEYKINNKKNNLILFNELVEGTDKTKITKKEKEFNAIILNKRPTGNFSKKQILINMINNKDYISIKSRIKSGDFSIPKNLCV